ncbi:uncharacterized protein LOC129579100 [Sitodiplosis mosellana]|uniref:uncharacterized protein LOC129579100 n=1 Tax=Sitodiplosis mosellana TaxID=263140 RepID=UPI0024442EC2|nr:uncharacterized protein LOC129579100 [Sitodiplosis mosellana]
MTNKPKVLILGGCGFVGRHLVTYLIKNSLVSHVRVVDKTPPQLAWLNNQHMAAFNDNAVEFCSANLINQASCKNAFKPPNDCDYPYWDHVFNCAAETRLGKSDAIYREGIYKLSLNCINEAIEQNVLRYIEFSSANMLSSEKKPTKENCERKPWTKVAVQKVSVEDELENRCNDLNYTILRLPLVYGIGDHKGLATRLVIAALYKYMNETMKLLWNESMKMNTVHVDDVVAAAFELAQNPLANKQCYNIVDDSLSTQGSISKILANIFNIKVDYWGEGLSNLSRLKIPTSMIVEEINDKHMQPWGEICRRDNTENTPLTPFMDAELIQHCHLNLSNEKLKSTGYRLKMPIFTQESIEEIVSDFAKQKLLPASLLY